jgi:hypothetical protein
MAIAIEGYTQAREGKLQVALDLLHGVSIDRLSKAHFDMAIDLLDIEEESVDIGWIKWNCSRLLVGKAC